MDEARQSRYGRGESPRLCGRSWQENGLAGLEDLQDQSQGGGTEEKVTKTQNHQAEDQKWLVHATLTERQRRTGRVEMEKQGLKEDI